MVSKREKSVRKVLEAFGMSEKDIDECVKTEIENGKWVKKPGVRK